MNLKPWEIEPALTMDRLCFIGKIIRDVRHVALSLHDPDEGDGPWSLGCRIYERTINKIEREAENLYWLNACRSDGLYFLIHIENIPLRFYKGSLDEPTSRTLQQRGQELRQLKLPFYQNRLFWRIAVETDQDGRVLQLNIAQFEESGNFRNPWEIPIVEAVSTIAPMIHTRREAPILDKPIILSKDEKGVISE